MSVTTKLRGRIAKAGCDLASQKAEVSISMPLVISFLIFQNKKLQENIASFKAELDEAEALKKEFISLKA